MSRENVGQYSCAGRNTAGEGEQSEGIFLDVQCKKTHKQQNCCISQKVFYSFNADLPDVAEVVLEDEPVKGEEVQLSCFLEDPGNPLATEFLWMK